MRYALACIFALSSFVYADKSFVKNVSLDNEPSKIYAEIERTFINRGWRIAEHGGEGVMGKINHRGVIATVTIYLANDKLLYTCKGTREVTTRRAAGGSGGIKKGKKVIDYCPKKWINNLRQDVAWFLK